ncbi:MAG: hypothetical protein SGJ05_03170 [bacterium]|nr:hypothetical protein [bacterium]
MLGLFSLKQKSVWLLLFLGATYAQLAGGTDSQRLLTAGLPILVILAGFAVEEWLRKRKTQRFDALVLSLLLLIAANIVYPAMHLPIWLEACVLLGSISIVYALQFLKGSLRLSEFELGSGYNHSDQVTRLQEKLP